MALKKEFITSKGIYTIYHRIDSVRINRTDEDTYMLVTVQSYADEKYRDESVNNSVLVRHYRFDVTMTELDTSTIFSLAYRKLKTTDDFTGAVDA